MLCLDEATVCKPLVKRELQFYETLPEAVSKFTPHFYGVIQVNVQPEEEGYVTLTANPPKFYKPVSSSPTRRLVIGHFILMYYLSFFEYIFTHGSSWFQQSSAQKNW